MEKQFTVTVEKRHCENRKYLDVENCPLCAAIREQLPDFKFTSVAGSYVNVTDQNKYFFNCFLNPELPGDSWNQSTIYGLMSGRIKSATVILTPIEQEAQASDAPKTPKEREISTKTVYVSVPESLKKQSEELILQ